MEEEKFVHLESGLSMRDLLGGEGTVFEISDEKEEEDESLQMPTSDEFLKSLSTNVNDCGDEVDELLTGPAGLISFSLLEAKMKNITQDGSVKKVIVRQGIGAVVPSNALVDVHYQGYFELADEPFDSTFLRGKPYRIPLETGSCLPGLEVAVASMKKNELSRFLIKPELAYGLLGVPPRIRPNAEVLFEVELLSFVDGVEAQAMAAIEKEASHSFATVYKVAEAKYLEGNECYKRKMYKGAISKYQKVRSLLEFVNLANAEEQDKQQKFLLKIYTNLALCYNKTATPAKACSMSQMALKINPKYCKVLFTYARALVMLHDYTKAVSLLTKARQMRPNDIEIDQELQKAYTKQREALALEKVNCAKMFSQPLPPETEELENEDMEDFKVEAKLILEEFCKSDARSQVLPSGMTQWERSVIKTDAAKLHLVAVQNADKSITITKTN